MPMAPTTRLSDGGSRILFATHTSRAIGGVHVDTSKTFPKIERRCLVTGEVRDIESLVRFVIGPDSVLMPDVEGKLPGRGFWVAAESVVLDQGVNKGHLKRALGRANAPDVVVPENLSELVSSLLARRCHWLFGLARRAGHVVLGFEKVRQLMASGRARLLVLASESGTNGDKLRRVAVNSDQPVGVIDFFDVFALAPVFGRVNWAYAAVRTSGFAERLLVDAERLVGFTTTKVGVQPTSTKVNKVAR